MIADPAEELSVSERPAQALRAHRVERVIDGRETIWEADVLAVGGCHDAPEIERAEAMRNPEREREEDRGPNQKQARWTLFFNCSGLDDWI
jgi:hypothetical protein